MTSLATRWRLKSIQAFDRLRLRRWSARTPGLELSAEASTNFSSSHFAIAPGGRLVIGPRVYTERRSQGVHISVAEGASVEIGADTWLRTDLAPVILFAFPGAQIRIGREGFLNGCHLSAKASLEIGDRVWIGPGSRVFDADQHDLDAERAEGVAPVRRVATIPTRAARRRPRRRRPKSRRRRNVLMSNRGASRRRRCLTWKRDRGRTRRSANCRGRRPAKRAARRSYACTPARRSRRRSP